MVVSSISAMLKNHYSNCFREHGESSLGVDWGTNERAVKMRHENMTQLFKREFSSMQSLSTSILDVGCGYGAFLDYLLYDKGVAPEFLYTGIDIVEEMINSAKQKWSENSGFQFITGDIFDTASLLNHDYVICNGILTQKLVASKLEMDNYCHELIKLMFKYADKGIAFNIMTDKVNYQVDNLYYRNPSEILSFCQTTLSSSVLIDHSYNMYEFTVYVYK